MTACSRVWSTALLLGCAMAHFVGDTAMAQKATPAVKAQVSVERAKPRFINISTGKSSLNLVVDADNRLYQLGYGKWNLTPELPTKPLNRLEEFLPPAGNGFIAEPAVQATHADGNTSTDLVYVRHTVSPVDANVTLTRIELKDSYYPFWVTLCFKTYLNEDVIEQWTETRHEEKRPVILYHFASSAPILRGDSYYLTQFYGDYKREATLAEERLSPGIKILDSKLGVRAHQMRNPSFLVSLGGPAQEEEGEVYGGTLAWSGSFQLAFEVDGSNRLRALCGINPFASQYHLERGTVFRTPSMLWTWSAAGKGQVSRNFHRWARRYGIRDGNKPRPVLLNNWEATGVKFDENRIVSLFEGAKTLGIDTFLLDDGWFGNAYPRNNDKAGLGDWQADKKKLPHGLSYLADQAKQQGMKFGIWLEPEMVNPASELFKKHPEWAMTQPHREPLYGRNQLILDLSRPAVRDFSWKVLDDTLGSNPGISYLKWDANRYVTQPGSTWLPPEKQLQLLIDYNWALYDVMARMAQKYPNVMAMVCAGGAGRVDYGALKYFHSFWPSDNTDPAKRVFIQWGFSHIFPASTISAHLTRMGKRPLKFATDVALSGAFGVDMDADKMTPEEKRDTANAIALYKEHLREVVAQGDLYRLESPYDHPRASLNYVSPDRSHAVLFVYQLKADTATAVKPRGLDPLRRYHVREVNLPANVASQLELQNQTVDGATLMRDGLVPPCSKEYESTVITLDVE